MLATVTVDAVIAAVHAAGRTLISGRSCRTAAHAVVPLRSKPGFDLKRGGRLAGRYQRPPFTGCGWITPLRPAVEAAGRSPLRGCVLGAMALSSGQFAEAERRFTEALAQARDGPDSGPLAALIASWLAGTYLLLGDGEKGVSFGRWALGTGCLDALATSWTRTQIAIGASEVAGPAAALAELGHLDADPARVGPLDAECLAFRGAFWMAAGDLGRCDRHDRRTQPAPSARDRGGILSHRAESV